MAAVDLHPPMSKSEPTPSSRSGGSRPSTQSGYRFGQMSKSSFFARHNPHPHRCIHIKGLLGLPIPVVVDDCDHSSYETHLCFPPNGHNDQKLLSQRLLLPVNSIHLNSHKHPIDTINGLQYFTNLRNYSFKEKAVPRLGLVPVTESWREQLRSLTEQTFHPMQPQQHQQQASDGAKPDSATVGIRREATYPAAEHQHHQHQQEATGPAASRPMYSRQTGRLIPPPSRAMSRRPLRSSRRATPAHVLAGYEHISAAPDLESAVFSMLCQILQTEDFNAVQAWLVSASDREKALVMDVIRSAVANRAAYYEADPTGEAFVEPTNIRDDLRLPPIAENGETAAASRRVDRLVIEDVVEPTEPATAAAAAAAATSDEEATTGKRQTEVPDAKPAAGTKTSKQHQQQQPVQKQQQKQQKKAGGAKPAVAKAASGLKLKYSKKEPGKHKAAAKPKDVWRPQESYAP